MTLLFWKYAPYPWDYIILTIDIEWYPETIDGPYSWVLVEDLSDLNGLLRLGDPSLFKLLWQIDNAMEYDWFSSISARILEGQFCVNIIILQIVNAVTKPR